MTLEERLIADIAHSGPMSVARFMAHALFDPQDGYYSRHVAIGADGDFITAPEASQMFGELLGLWAAHEWQTALHAPARVQLVELGPGRGALMADAWRAARVAAGFHASAHVSLLEPSPRLRQVQAAALARVGLKPLFVDALAEVAPGATLLIANEVLDCLPIRQFVRTDDGWRERLVGLGADGGLAFGLAPAPLPAPPADLPPTLLDAPAGTVAEIAPGLPALVDAIAARLTAAPGRALLIDYGSTPGGDTLQAVRAHQKVPPLTDPGRCDLTAHVDFGAVRRLARASGLRVDGPIPQGAFLSALGLHARAEALAQAAPDRADRIARETRRLTDPAEMGVLFQVLCLSTPTSPPPAGFP